MKEKCKDHLQAFLLVVTVVTGITWDIKVDPGTVFGSPAKKNE